MTKIHKMIPIKDLNLTNRFLFDEVMEDPETHRAVLNIIFGTDIPPLEMNQTEKEGRLSPSIRSVRMDVYAIDEEKTVYNTEMQEERKTDLAKRSRYYQALIDTGLLEPGIPNYNLLNNSFIIMIMPFDLFGYKKYVYTFESRCREVPECILKDGATRIFLNTKGTNDDEVSDELREFLRYVENTTDDVVSQSDSCNIRKIHERVCKVKANEEVGVKYMQAWEEKYFAMEEAREIGLAEGRAAGMAEGRAEGRAEGQEMKLREMIEKKLRKGKKLEVIADELEEDFSVIEEIVKGLKKK